MGMVCCAEYCAFTALNSVCSCLNGNFGYPLIVLLFTVMGLVFRFDDDAQGSLDWLAEYGGFKGCDNVASDVKNLCLGTQFVLRGGFTLTIFFAGMMLLVACCRRKAHDSAFMLKFLVLGAMFVGTLWVPDDNIYRFAKVAVIGAGFFIAAQVLCLLEFSYAWNEEWRSWDGNGQNRWKYLILVISVFMLLGCIGFIIASYILFTEGSGCGGGIAQITTTLLTCIIFTLLSTTTWCEHGALLPSAVVALYSGYYCFSALSSWPSSCNHFYNDNTDTGSGSITNVIIGLVFTVLGVAYSAMSTANQFSDDQIVQIRTVEQPLNADDKYASDADMDGASIWALMRYHIVMMLASMYMTMVLCSWQVDSPESNTLENFGINKWSMIVKLVSQWVAVALYFWTLIAPMVLTGRKFDFQ